ncbi:hypothetical protein CYPRO_1518 [Cyclonatronum proteinivorum]|uniref:Glycosyltransferase, GT2 family n=1 Tax=Cyclonatronum proteinivorum TaxID=1457365 RepID=A0A345UJW7_9BACT|nr:glycosyltransferase [Cyclonatronum proteinivorum]AXJ00769.1 hypothetical protein CYPRO_1518 [Cyclonatronum proteinivorum]
MTELADSPETKFEHDISIVIVNYNVKEYLANLLHSVYKAAQDLRLEIFVVDNFSSDGSVAFLKERFPEVIYIENFENKGFGKANNQAIIQATGKYTLLVNPDVLIGEDTLGVLFNFMEAHPDVGASGCKILNPDGTFAPESRRSVPTPMNAMYKVLGLTKLFPNHPRFASYYVGGQNEDEASDIEVLSGSFMFYRTGLLQELNGFDERFFMYGEDIDLCYRTLKAGYRIRYVPDTSIIHYKGESTKKENLRYIITFNKVLYQFFEKHYSYGYSIFFKYFILLGVVTKSAASYVFSLFNRSLRPVSDLLLLNLVLVGFFLYRYSIAPADIFQAYQPIFLSVNFLHSAAYLIFAKYYGLYNKNLHSWSHVVKALLFSLVTVASITFFFRDIAFSRLILLATTLVLLLLLPAIRLVTARFFYQGSSAKGRIQPVRLLVAGIGDHTQPAIRKIRGEVDWNYDIIGLVTQRQDEPLQTIEDIPVLGHVSQLPEMVKNYRADQVIFMLEKISHVDVLSSLSQLRDTQVVCKVVPGSLDYIIGKSNVEYFDDVPVVDLEIPSLTAWNRLLKRAFDFSLSGFFLFVMFLPWIFLKLNASIKKTKRETVNLFIDSSTSQNIAFFTPYSSHRLLNTITFMRKVFTGEFSLVGAPIIPSRQGSFVYYKPGLTGQRQLNEDRLFRDDEKQRQELHYLQTYSIWKDVEILFKYLSGPRKHFTAYLQERGAAAPEKSA